MIKKIFNKKLIEQLILVGFGTLLTLLITIITNWQSNKRLDEEWRRNQISSITNDVINRRLELLEKTTKYFNKYSLFELYETQHDFQRKFMDNIEKHDFTASEFKENLNDYAENFKNYIDLHSEVATTLSLSKYYFGPQTKEAVEKLIEIKPTDSTSNWYKKNPKLFSNVISAMEKEVAFQVDLNFSKD